jgi:hypothetical protein
MEKEMITRHDIFSPSTDENEVLVHLENDGIPIEIGDFGDIPTKEITTKPFMKKDDIDKINLTIMDGATVVEIPVNETFQLKFPHILMTTTVYHGCPLDAEAIKRILFETFLKLYEVTDDE